MIFLTAGLTGLAGCLGATSDEITTATAPVDIVIDSVTTTSVGLSWSDVSLDETEFGIQYCSGQDCTNFTDVPGSPLPADTTSYIITDLTPGTTYRFRVRTLNAGTFSPWLTSANVATGSAPVNVVTNTCSSPVTSTVDFGQRATTSTTLALRGAHSDIALITGTNNPAVAYSETHTAGAASLKFMYWNGSEFKYETVAGGVTATYIKLVYLPSGIPLIFWGNGATGLFGAARSSASITSEGAWTALALDTSSTAIRGVDAAVNPDGEVAIFFMTNTAAASGTKSIICTSNCSTMTATNYPAATVVDTVATATATYSIGTAWCRSASDYYPVAFYGSSANFRLATCRQANLSTCSGNWSSGIIGAANANRVTADMYIDETATDGTVYMTAIGATGIIPMSMPNCATATPAATWGSVTIGTTFGAATTGSAWLNMARDASDNFHVVANDGVTLVRYFNNTAANFTAGVWNAAPSTNYPETTGAAGLPAAGAGRGAMIVDNTGDQVLVSYGRTAAVTPVSTWGNLVLAYNECTSATGSPACASTTLGSSAASTGMWWGNMAADSTGQIQKTSLAWPNVDVAVSETGVPAVAYVDYSVSGTADPVVGARLKYAYRKGSSSADDWEISIIGTQSAPQSPSLAFDSNNLPWVAWNETPSATVALRFFLATNSRTDGSGAWTIYSFPSFYAVGAVTAQPVMAQSALVMYKVGAVTKPLMVTMSSISTVAGREVRAALFDPVTRQWQNNKQIATFAGALTIGGASLTADADTSGNIVVAFNDMSTGAGQVNCSSLARCIRMSYTTDGGATWTSTSTSGVINGTYEMAHVKLNPLNSRPAITYFDRANNQVRYRYCNTALASCTSSANWVDLGVGIVDGGLGISGLAEATNLGVLGSGFSFTQEGMPWVVYPRGAGAVSNANLSYNYVSPTANVFGTPAAFYTSPGVGNLLTPVAATANNIALSWNPSSVRSSVTGSLHTAYIAPGNFLQVTSCGN
jgi:hypothetical protein